MRTILDFLKNYKFTILVVFYFFIITIYPIDFNPRLIFLLGSISLVFFLNIISKMKFPTVWTILFSILISFNAFFSFIHKGYISLGLVGSMVETNKLEASTMLEGVALPAILIITITTALIWLSVRELKNWKFNRRKSLLAIFIYCYFLSPIVYRRIVITDMREIYNDAPAFVVQHIVNYYSPLVYGNVCSVYAYINEIMSFKEFANTERHMPDGFNLDESKDKINKLYIVIGESSTRGRYSLYNYEAKTNPFLDSIATYEPENIRYYDGIAAASFTRNAVPIMLSTAHARNFKNFFSEYNLLDLAKKAGYEVVWISNQPRMDLISVVENYVGFLAENADETFFSSYESEIKDIDLLPIIEEHQKGDDVPQIFIIHLMGSHQQYWTRYQEEDKLAIQGEGNPSLDYDRSIHMTDRVLEGVYELSKKHKSSAMYYAPDHGEEVGVGHGLSPINKSIFSIPMVYLDNNSGLKIDSLVAPFINPLDSTVNNSSSIYILSEMMGYSIDDKLKKRELENGKYVQHGDGSTYLFKDIP